MMRFRMVMRLMVMILMMVVMVMDIVWMLIVMWMRNDVVPSTMMRCMLRLMVRMVLKMVRLVVQLFMVVALALWMVMLFRYMSFSVILYWGDMTFKLRLGWWVNSNTVVWLGYVLNMVVGMRHWL